ncbi:hypothetical protein D1816_13755 [Aquimarina sp. AD10]|uniref:DUF6443 domain-containing protein n=1 Tax=Aquimarina sp. AD10 TaxID=1714849 RepID=UPI000E4801DE|nr:DUF6443 domain-containing protein [Aquimarina sp. AD10]AXT61366.1 hypothetical protein D1816_13755 [Aquimarina sp. AD10]RKN01440.1 hypothetical protein D7033_04220 [Aquimarina sp. AD10]
MRKIAKYITVALLFVGIAVQAQTQANIVKQGDYTVTGNEPPLIATQSITLKPNSWIKSGSNFSAVIAPNAYLPINLSNSENYVFTRVYQEAMTSASSISNNSDVIDNITYFDGLGRPKQQIGMRASPDLQDIVTHIKYDKYGRLDKEYLPYVSSETVGSYKEVNVGYDINRYYQNKYPDDFTGMALYEVNANSQSIYEPSPLNRVLERGAPGKDWKADSGSDADHTIKFDRNSNVVNEVIYFKVSFPTENREAPTLTKYGYYSINQLYITTTKDENWTSGNNHTTKEYKDKQGRVVLKRTYNNNIAHDTYYVYDDFGNLTYVIPPKVTLSATDGVSDTELSELCYQYKYDYRNRLIEKKIPGKGWEYIIYNRLNQVVMTQDANMKSNNYWLFTKYDAIGRVAYTGKLTDSRDRKTIQNEVNAYTGALWVERSSALMIGGVKMYYNDGSYPNAQNAEVLTVNYFDDFGFLASEDSFFNNPNVVFGQTIDNRTKSLATGNKVKVLGTVHWVTSATYYDSKGRPIYIATQNSYLNTSDIVETKLDFVGKPIKTRTTHIKGNNTPIVAEDTFTYDHMSRALKQVQNIGGQEETIVESSYDELGQLESKTVGGGLQTVDYKRNIRGWTTQINDPNNLGNDLFVFKLSYGRPAYGATALYNGDISETEWRTASDNILRWNTYQFDALGRLLDANSSNNRYDVSNITYNKNGGILSITRNGWQNSSNYTNLDVLSFTYDNGNKQIAVNDIGNKTHGFRDGNNSEVDYEYDLNGNRIVDRNKGVSSITYNHLNLPQTIAASTVVEQRSVNGNIQYVYDANANKLQKTVTNNGNTVTTDYSGNYIYENSVLKSITHPEGYIEPENDGTFNFVYQFKDNVENVRLSYSDRDGDGKIDVVRNNLDVDGDGDNNQEILEENNYYPFGGKHQGYNTLIGSTNPALRFKFSNKELVEELALGIYDYGARQYDPFGVTWWGIDPLADQFTEWSPYVYSYNSPILFYDPDGMAPNCCEPELPKFLDNFFGYLERTVGPAINEGGEKLGNFIADFHPGVSALRTVQGVESGEIGAGGVALEIASSLPVTKWLKFGDEALDVASIIAKNGDEAAEATQTVAKNVDEAKSLTDSGGAYGRFDNIKDTKTGKNITEKNHIPTTKSYDLAGFNVSKYIGSAHIMKKADHRAFITTGSSKAAKAFRNLEGKLLGDGKFLEAFDLNAAAIRKQFGNKYDEGLKQAREHYVNEVIPKLSQQAQ